MNALHVVRIGNGKVTHHATDFDLENGYADCGVSTQSGRSFKARQAPQVLDPATPVTCSKCVARIAARITEDPTADGDGPCQK